MRALLLLAAMLSVPAWATGERVVLSPATNPLRDTVCISMNCVTGGSSRDVTVSARSVKTGLEFTVTSAGGQVRLVHVAPLKSDGKVSSTDLMHASTLVVQAIEGGAVAKEAAAPAPAPAKKKVAKTASKKLKLRMLASNR